jgi:PAS domain S-box-containing protein
VSHLVRTRRHTPKYTKTTDAQRPGAGASSGRAPHAAEQYAVYDALSDIVCVTTFDGTLRFLNRAGRELLGYVDDDAALIGCIFPAHTPAARELLLDEVVPAALRHGRATGDTALQTADGRVFPAAQTVVVTPHHFDAPMTLTVIIRDVSIERQASRRLAESQRLFEMIARTSPDLMYLYDPADQRVVWMNRCPHAFLGGEERDARTLSRREIARLVHRDDLLPFRNDAARIATAYGDTDTVTTDVRLRTRGGTWRWIQTRATVFSRRENGEPLLVLGIASDIGPLKKAEARLMAARDNAERSNQDKHTFVTRLSGELHRSIDSVIGLVSEVRANRDGRLTVREIEQLAQATDTALRLRSTVTDLTDYTRMESGEVTVHQEPCDIPTVIRETVAAFAGHPRAASSPVVTILPTPAATALVDRARLRQALTHVLAHVLAHTGDTEVVVRLQTDAQTGAPMAIEIEDTGAAHDLTRHYDPFIPFHRAPRAAQSMHHTDTGTGLGLALTRTLCEMIGCALELATLDGGSGSTFRIVLPQRSRNAQLAAEYPKNPELPTPGIVTDPENVIPLM